MQSHIFGGASSHSCSSYELKRTAFDNKEKLGNEAANTLINNLYVDNLLKSLLRVEEAKRLIKTLSRYILLGDSSSKNL